MVAEESNHGRLDGAHCYGPLRLSNNC
jgi:hypothetical protein